MRKIKRGMAVALAATMVMGSSFTAFAADATPSNKGSATGAGSSEGHLEKKVTNVTLPTDSDTTTFKYTIDPERLVQETNGGKYDGITFPAKDSDTGVYFMTDATKYENTSKKLTVTNMSSHDINLKVTAKAADTNASTDIALAESSTIEGTTPKLYLGLNVGSDTKAISTTETSITTRVAGKAENFEVTVKEDSGNKVYAYEEKTGATGWATTDISMTGACNAATVTDALTAPQITVTWEFEEATGPSVAITSGGVITITGLTEATDPTDMNLIDLEDNNKAYNLTSQSSTWTATGSAAEGTIVVKLGEAWFGLANKEVKIELDLKDGSKISNTTTLGTGPSDN